MDALQHFASRQMKVRFVWGVNDCITMPADWVDEVAGFDPMLDLRGRYDSAASCQRMTGFLTDPLRLIEPRMSPFAKVALSEVARGDVGVVLSTFAGAMQPHGAVHLGDGLWLARGLSGISAVPVYKILAAWRPSEGTT
jgi:hypothetical protein